MNSRRFPRWHQLFHDKLRNHFCRHEQSNYGMHLFIFHIVLGAVNVLKLEAAMMLIWPDPLNNENFQRLIECQWCNWTICSWRASQFWEQCLPQAQLERQLQFPAKVPMTLSVRGFVGPWRAGDARRLSCLWTRKHRLPVLPMQWLGDAAATPLFARLPEPAMAVWAQLSVGIEWSRNKHEHCESNLNEKSQQVQVPNGTQTAISCFGFL